jgi:hypothetical protein
VNVVSAIFYLCVRIGLVCKDLAIGAQIPADLGPFPDDRLIRLSPVGVPRSCQNPERNTRDPPLLPSRTLCPARKQRRGLSVTIRRFELDLNEAISFTSSI